MSFKLTSLPAACVVSSSDQLNVEYLFCKEIHDQPKNHNLFFYLVYFEGGSGEEGHAAVLHLAADQSDGDGRPRHHADADLVVQLGHVQLRLVAAEHVVLGLLDDGRDAVELPAVGVRLHNLDGRPPGRAPVHHPALIDHVVQCSHHLCKCRPRSDI